MRYPLDSVTITQGYRANPNTRGYGAFGHPGVDLRASVGTSVKSEVIGTVKAVGTNPKYIGGLYVIIRQADKPNYEFYTGHLSKILVKVGQTVKEGQEIAKSGMTGSATAPHVHYQVRKANAGELVDPTKLPYSTNQGTVDDMSKPTKAEVGDMFNYLGIADDKVTDAQYKHYMARDWKVLGQNIAKELYKQKKDLQARLKNSGDPTSNDQAIKDSLFNKIKGIFGK